MPPISKMFLDDLFKMCLTNRSARVPLHEEKSRYWSLMRLVSPQFLGDPFSVFLQIAPGTRKRRVPSLKTLLKLYVTEHCLLPLFSDRALPQAILELELPYTVLEFLIEEFGYVYDYKKKKFLNIYLDQLSTTHPRIFLIRSGVWMYTIMYHNTKQYVHKRQLITNKLPLLKLTQ
jgi:hypothetical protein